MNRIIIIIEISAKWYIISLPFCVIWTQEVKIETHATSVCGILQDAE